MDDSERIKEDDDILNSLKKHKYNYLAAEVFLDCSPVGIDAIPTRKI